MFSFFKRLSYNRKDLKSLSKILRDNTKNSDIIARFGGEEML